MKFGLFGLALAAVVGAQPASAETRLLDCPLRDAPFSVSSPLVDVLLSDTAKAEVDTYFPGAITRIPPFFAGTKAPTFASIITIEKVGPMIGVGGAKLGALDGALRALPVTAADKVARCARYDADRPAVRFPKGRLRVLLFDKMTGFRDAPSVNAADAAFKAMADRKGWALVTTDKGGAMTPSILKNVDVVIWNNVSGDVLTLSQRKAFRSYIERGGGFVGIHGSAGDPVYFWDWYPDTLIGARFTGHPSAPQFQDATIRMEPHAGGIGRDIATDWRLNDEWYSFAVSARANGAKVVATLDERSYQPGSFLPGGPSIAMGADHPIAWTRCVGKGRSFYSAIGHRPETYADPNHLALLEQAIAWAADRNTLSCKAKGRP